MKTLLAAAAILVATTSIGWSQSTLPCDPSDPSDMTGSCTTAPRAEPTFNIQGTFDQGATSAIPQPSTPQGMAPLVVPSDPLNTNLNQNPLGTFPSVGPSGNSGTIGGITSPSIQSPSVQ